MKKKFKELRNEKKRILQEQENLRRGMPQPNSQLYVEAREKISTESAWGAATTDFLVFGRS